ncbi:MAG: hypothetical protein ACYC9S_11605 [Leptospirales bacterium]
MGFRVFQGILDGTILIFLAIVVSYLRVLRRSVQRLRRERILPAQSVYSGRPDPGEPELASAVVRDLNAATDRAGSMRDRMELLLHDAERWIEDLGNLERLQKSRMDSAETHSGREPVMVEIASLPKPDPLSEPKSDVEKVRYLAGQGHSIREIAQSLGRGEGEVELMLGLSRLSDGRSSSGR